MNEKLEFDDLPFGSGIIARQQYDNGFGCCVIQSDFSWGAEDGLYEMALTDSCGDLYYDNDKFKDVIGYLTLDEVDELVNYIKAKDDEARL